MKKWLYLILVLAVASSVAKADIGFQGWGLRGGLSVDPDQVHLGVHMNLGEFIPNLRFQPNAELGFGDDVFLLMLNGATFYLFDISESNFKLYTGGELTIAYWRVDTPVGDADDVELGLSPLGGIEFPFSRDVTGFVELKFGIGDVPDFRVTVGVHL